MTTFFDTTNSKPAKTNEKSTFKHFNCPISTFLPDDISTMINLKSCLAGWMIYLLIPANSLAGGENPGTGARSMGFGNASVANKDPYAINNNIAGIASLEKINAFVSYEIPFSIISIKRINAGVIFPFKEVRTGISFSNFGNEYYNEFRAGVGVAHKMRNVSLGLKVDYNEISISENGTRRNIFIEFGGITEFSKHLQFGAHVFNINQASIGNGHTSNTLPVIMKAGVSILPISNLRINIETEKQTLFKPFIKAGMEYVFAKILAVRAGISTNTNSNFFGIGVIQKKFMMDYAISTHSYLGLSHTLSLIYIFHKKK